MRLSVVSINTALLLLGSQVVVADDYTLSRCLCSSENRWGYGFEYNVTTPSIAGSSAQSHTVARIWNNTQQARWSGAGTIIPTPAMTGGTHKMTAILDKYIPHNKIFDWFHKLLAKREAHHILPSLVESCNSNSTVCGDDKFLNISMSTNTSDERVLPKKPAYTKVSSSLDCNTVCENAFRPLGDTKVVALCEVADIGRFTPWGNHDSKCKEIGYTFPAFRNLETAENFMQAKLKKTVIWTGIIGLSILFGLIAGTSYAVFSCCRRLRRDRSFSADRSDSES